MGLFGLLLALETTKAELTESEQHWRKQTVTLFGCILNILLAGAGIGLVAALMPRISESRVLIAPLAWSTMQA
jgi:hypothetical protein